MTTKSDIRGWLREASEKGATHMLVLCDQMDFSDFPMHVMPGQDAQTVLNEYTQKNTAIKVMECYSLSRDIEGQLNEHRARHYD